MVDVPDYIELFLHLLLISTLTMSKLFKLHQLMWFLDFNIFPSRINQKLNYNFNDSVMLFEISNNYNFCTTSTTVTKATDKLYEYVPLFSYVLLERHISTFAWKPTSFRAKWLKFVQPSNFVCVCVREIETLCSMHGHFHIIAFAHNVSYGGEYEIHPNLKFGHIPFL